MKCDEEVLFALDQLHEKVFSNSSSQCNGKIEITIVPIVLCSIAWLGDMVGSDHFRFKCQRSKESETVLLCFPALAEFSGCTSSVEAPCVHPSLF